MKKKTKKKATPRRKHEDRPTLQSFGFVRELTYTRAEDGKKYRHVFKRKTRLAFTRSGKLLVVGPVRRLAGNWIDDAR